MNPYPLPVFQTLWRQRATTDGRIALWGSVIQLPFAIAMLIDGWRLFPNENFDAFLTAGLLHLAMPVALVGTYVRRGARLEFRKSAALTALLLVLALVPFSLSLPLLA